MELLIFWVIMAIIAGMIASSKGSSFFLFFIYGLLIWPIAIVHALLKRRAPDAATQAAPALSQHQARTVSGVLGGTPYWREPDGMLAARIGGDVLKFPNMKMLEATLSGTTDTNTPPSAIPPTAPPTSISEPEFMHDGRVKVIVDGNDRYFPSLGAARRWIANVNLGRISSTE